MMKRYFIILLLFCASQTGNAQAKNNSSILVLYTNENFGQYTAEILRTEGFSQYELRKQSAKLISGADLKRFEVLILAAQTVEAKQVSVIAEYVKNGGKIIAFRPDKKLNAVFGIQYKNAAPESGYVGIDSTSSIGHGLITNRFKIHTPVDQAVLSTGSMIASFYAKRNMAKGSPAVVFNKYGKGEAVAFLYNLPANIVYTRQGNPLYAGKEGDGITGLRAMDLFTGGWVDTLDNLYNHADEQMRLLSHAIEELAQRPFPRLWYFPDTLKTLVTLNNDGEDSKEEEFEPQFADVDAKGAKMTLYIKETHLVSRAFTDKWQQRGFEISGHPDHTKEATKPRWKAMDSIYKDLTSRLKNAYGVDGMKTVTNHWFVWCGLYADSVQDFTAQAKLEEMHGVGLDCNYAHYDNNSNQGHFLGASGWRQGNYTGSGLAMKFADTKGNVIDVYQQLNNVYDQQYMEQKDQDGYFNCFRGLFDRSIHDQVYSYISIRAHNNEYYFSKDPLMKILDYANEYKVPVWSELMLLDFLRTREDAKFADVSYENDKLEFELNSSVSTGHNLTCMVPFNFNGKAVGKIWVNNTESPVNIQTVKGTAYAFIPVKSGIDHKVTVEYTAEKVAGRFTDSSRVFCGHPVQLDRENKLLPRKVDAANTYDDLLRLRWSFVQKRTPLSPGPAPRSCYPQYYFYCAFIDSAGQLIPDRWMNDVGEKIPMWMESARLYRDYSGDEEPLKIAKGLVDYSIQHGITPADFAWPAFPYTTANAGDLEFRGFTTRFAEHDLHVDHAGDIGATYYKMYLLYKDPTYKSAAIGVANVLARKVQKGSATHSPWPYVVNAKTGKVVSEYGTNWFGCLRLFDLLIEGGEGKVDAYKDARKTVLDWLFTYPFKNGKWVDGHTDTYITGTTNLSNLSASNAGLYLSDHPEITREWKQVLPSLIKWTEENFVFRSQPGEPSQFWGANIVSEQVAFMPKMDYQTARYAAQCAKWFAMGGDESFREKAFRSLNFVTYCNDSTGKVFESPFSKGVNSWWSDSYGECPIMFYHALGAIPDFAPEKENHLLYSSSVVRDVSYGQAEVSYTTLEKTGSQQFRLNFKPATISFNGQQVYPGSTGKVSVKLNTLNNGDYALMVTHGDAGKIEVRAAR